MQPDWIADLARLGPWIVAIVAIVAWGFKGRCWSGNSSEARRQTDLLERIAANLERNRASQ
jgi:hypothetical protein